MFGQILSSYRFRERECRDFKSHLKALYQAIFDVSDARVVIDSSKYPSRLWHLTQILPKESLLVVHLRRKASSVINAMQTADQGRPRSRLTAAAYYHGVEFLISQVLKTVPSSQFIDIQYEYLMQRPRNTLQSLNEHFGLDVEGVIEKVRNGVPLKRGNVFNGNRMRMQESVIFRKKPYVIENK
jgi:hypothetical protein